MNPRPRPSAVAFRPDGSSYMVDEAGNAVPDDQRIAGSAGEVARLVGAYVAAERQAGSESTAQLLQATADAAADAAAQATAQPAFDAGVKYAAAEIMAKSRIRRTVERDADGKVTGSIETREPLPPPPEKRIGFRPRRPTKETP